MKVYFKNHTKGDVTLRSKNTKKNPTKFIENIPNVSLWVEEFSLKLKFDHKEYYKENIHMTKGWWPKIWWIALFGSANAELDTIKFVSKCFRTWYN